MSNFYTTFETTDVIPVSDHGYVITPDGKIHMLRYRFSHNYIICSLFRKYLPDFDLSFDNIDSDRAVADNKINKFVSAMPTIRISRDKTLTYHYNFWFVDNLVNQKMIDSFRHIIKNVYGCDGSERCDYVAGCRTLSDLLNLIGNIK